MKAHQTMKYFIYARKSTDTEDRQVRSIPDQLAEMRELAVRHELQIADIFTESQTAKEPGRPVFNDMLDRIETGEASGILAWHPDRIARNWSDGGRFMGLLESGKLKDLKFSTFAFEMSAAGKYMLAMMLCQSTYYSANLSDNVKRAFRHKLHDGLWPQKAPIGYLNDKVKRLIVDPERGPLIQQAFALYATGKYTLAHLGDELYSMGLRSAGGCRLSISNIQFVLRNPFYHGMMRFNGEFHEGRHPPLISKALFDKVQAVMSTKGKPGRVLNTLKPYLYRQMFVCAGCGATMTIETQKGHTYLRCTRKLGRCSQPFVREEAIGDQIAKAMEPFALPADIADWLVAQLETEQSQHLSMVDHKIQEARDQVRSKSGQIERLILALTDGTLSNEEFRAAKNRVVLEKRELEEKAVTLEKTRTNWLEPSIRFVNASKQATFLLQMQNSVQIRDFFRKVGSNRRIDNKRVVFEPRGAWKTLVPVDRFARQPNAAPGGAASDAGELVQHVSKLGD